MLLEFETVCVRDTRKIYFNALHLFELLSNEVFGTRATDIQVEVLSMRKKDEEVHFTEALTDALFRVILAMRFCRRGEALVDSGKKF